MDLKKRQKKSFCHSDKGRTGRESLGSRLINQLVACVPFAIFGIFLCSNVLVNLVYSAEWQKNGIALVCLRLASLCFACELFTVPHFLWSCRNESLSSVGCHLGSWTWVKTRSWVGGCTPMLWTPRNNTHWVFALYPVLARIQEPRWWPVELNDWSLWLYRKKIGDYEQSSLLVASFYFLVRAIMSYVALMNKIKAKCKLEWS